MSENPESIDRYAKMSRRTLLASGTSLAAVSAQQVLAGNGDGSALKWPVAAAASMEGAPSAPFETFRDYIKALEAHGLVFRVPRIDQDAYEMTASKVRY